MEKQAAAVLFKPQEWQFFFCFSSQQRGGNCPGVTQIQKSIYTDTVFILWWKIEGYFTGSLCVCVRNNEYGDKQKKKYHVIYPTDTTITDNIMTMNTF